MHIILNGKPSECDCRTVGELLNGKPDGSIALVNGRHMEPDACIKNGDSVILIPDGGFVNSVAGRMLSDRYTPAIHDMIKNACIGIAGLGGVGSHIAESLARVGIGHLVIVDFDKVDMTNLNRQNYFIDDIGKSKAECTASLLKRINPDLDLKVYDIRIDEGNAMGIFGKCDVVCEAFDTPQAKSMLVETLLYNSESIKIVSVSGLAGFSDTESMHCIKRMNRLYVCGDGTSDSSVGAGLTATRVMTCAGMAAHTALRIILGRSDE